MFLLSKTYSKKHAGFAYENRIRSLHAHMNRKYNNESDYADIDCLNSLEGGLLATTFLSKTIEKQTHKMFVHKHHLFDCWDCGKELLYET